MNDLPKPILVKDGSGEMIVLGDVAQSLNLSLDQIEYIGRKFTEIFEKNGSSRNGLVMVHGSLYAVGSRNRGNQEWREHAAHSIRELLHKWKRKPRHIYDEFKNTFFLKNKDFPTVDKDPDIYERMVSYYEYFSCICHHEANNIIVCARKLDGDLKKCGHDTEEDFLEKVTDFYRYFYNFFSKYTD